MVDMIRFKSVQLSEIVLQFNDTILISSKARPNFHSSSIRQSFVNEISRFLFRFLCKCKWDQFCNMKKKNISEKEIE